MSHVRFITVGLLLVTGLFVAGQERCVAIEPSPSKQPQRDAVVIALRPNVQMGSRVILLGDVANITGGDPTLRERLKQLDIEDVLSPGESVAIVPPQVEFRLRVARIDLGQVSIRGNSAYVTGISGKRAGEVELANGGTTSPVRVNNPRGAVDLSGVSVGEGPLEHEIVQAAKKCVLNKLPWSAENVDIRLSLPVSAEVRQVNSVGGYQCSAELRTTGPAVGRVQVRVIAEAPQKQTFDVSVALEVRHFDTVVLTTKLLERGHTITAADVYTDRQDVTDLADYCSSMNELIGTTTKRSIRALVPLRMNDVDLVNRSENPVLIKRRDQVKMIARVGGLNVSATGEALQDGRLGEMIQLRNLDSKANVQGRVISPGEVEISF